MSTIPAIAQVLTHYIVKREIILQAEQDPMTVQPKSRTFSPETFLPDRVFLTYQIEPPTTEWRCTTVMVVGEREDLGHPARPLQRSRSWDIYFPAEKSLTEQQPDDMPDWVFALAVEHQPKEQ